MTIVNLQPTTTPWSNGAFFTIHSLEAIPWSSGEPLLVVAQGGGVVETQVRQPPIAISIGVGFQGKLPLTEVGI